MPASDAARAINAAKHPRATHSGQFVKKRVSPAEVRLPSGLLERHLYNLDEPDVRVRFNQIEDQHHSLEDLYQIVKEESQHEPNALLAVVLHPKADPELLDRATRVPDHGARNAAVRNLLTPMHTLLRIHDEETPTSARHREEATAGSITAAQLLERSEHLASLSKQVHDLRVKHNRL